MAIIRNNCFIFCFWYLYQFDFYQSDFSQGRAKWRILSLMKGVLTSTSKTIVSQSFFYELIQLKCSIFPIPLKSDLFKESEIGKLRFSWEWGG